MKVLFVDESGDSFNNFDPLYPVFVLGGSVMDVDYAKEDLAAIVASFKREHCESQDTILRCSDMTKNRNGFGHLQDAERRVAFYEGLNGMMSGIEQSIIACAVKTDGVIATRRQSEDLYFDALSPLVERFCMGMDFGERGWIYVESRSPAQDKLLLAEWRRITECGTGYLSAESVRRKIIGLEVRTKSMNLPGLQIADLIVNPIGRMVVGRKANTVTYDVIIDKMRKRDGVWRGYGLVLFA